MSVAGRVVQGNLTLVLAIAASDGELARGDAPPPPSDNRLALLYTGHILQVVSPSALNEWWGKPRKSKETDLNRKISECRSPDYIPGAGLWFLIFFRDVPRWRC